MTVLKDGRTATGLAAKETPTAELIRLMTGRSIEYVFPRRRRAETAADGADLDLAQSLAGVFRHGFDVRPGEVSGLAGLVGSGRSEILETLYGAAR